MNINRVTLQHKKEFIVFFLFNGFITQAFKTRDVLSTPATENINGKLQERLLTINKRNIIR